MKKLFGLVILTFLPSLLPAQETYSIAATAGQVRQLDRDRGARNRQTCQRFGLVVSCTQAQVCVAAGAVGGAGCTAAQARAATARIYPATQAGREEFLIFDLVIPSFRQREEDASRDEKKAVCAWFSTQTQATKDAECAKWGLAAGCDPCQ